jgi:O-methyltransferase domain
VLEALRDYDFSSVATWCDLGGGHGHMMCCWLAAYPHLSGTVLDLPEVVAEKDQLWAGKLGLEERCRYVAADMFQHVPIYADVSSLKMILHDWNDAECLQILRTIRQRARPKGRIFIVEHIVPGPSQPHFSKLFDIHMMCWGDRPGAHGRGICFASRSFRLALRRLPLSVPRQHGRGRRRRGLVSASGFQFSDFQFSVPARLVRRSLCEVASRSIPLDSKMLSPGESLKIRFRF